MSGLPAAGAHHPPNRRSGLRARLAGPRGIPCRTPGGARVRPTTTRSLLQRGPSSHTCAITRACTLAPVPITRACTLARAGLSSCTLTQGPRSPTSRAFTTSSGGGVPWAQYRRTPPRRPASPLRHRIQPWGPWRRAPTGSAPAAGRPSPSRPAAPFPMRLPRTSARRLTGAAAGRRPRVTWGGTVGPSRIMCQARRAHREREVRLAQACWRPHW